MFRIPLNYDENVRDFEKVFRSKNDGRLITPRMIKEGIGAGEQLIIVQSVTLLEWLMLKFRILR